MPYWIPKTRKIEDDIAEEQARIEELRLKRSIQSAPVEEPPTFQPQVPIWQPEQPSERTMQRPTEEAQLTVPIESVPQLETTQPVWTPPDLTRAPVVSKGPLVTPTESPTAWYEQPKIIAGKGQEVLAKGISKVPVLPEALKFVSPAFDWIHRNAELPWAAAITSPFSPTLPSKPGESWLEKEKREYEAWNAPTYVKGVAEFALPLWWLPWAGWTGKGAKALMGAGTAAKLAKIVPKTASEAILPTYEALEKIIPENIYKKMALWSENKPIVSEMVKAVGGPAAFTKRNPISAADKARNYAVFYGVQRDMGQNLVRTQTPDLYVKAIVNGKLTKESDLLKLFDTEVFEGQVVNGRVGVVKAKPEAKSLYFDDVVQSPNAYLWTDKAAYEYVKQGHEIVDWFQRWAKAQGVDIPSAKRGLQVAGDVMQAHIPRIAKGKVTETGKALFKRTDPFEEMIFATAKDGIEAGVKYGGTFAERVELVSEAITRRVAKEKFSEALKGLGKTALERLEELEPEFVSKLTTSANRANLLNKTLSALKLAAPLKGGYRPLHGSALNRIETEFPELATAIAQETSIRPMAIADWLTKSSKAAQLIVGRDTKPVVEALKALPDRASLDQALRVVGEFTSSEQKAIRLVEYIFKKESQADLGNYKTRIKTLIDTTQGMLDTEKGIFKPLLSERRQLVKAYGAKIERQEAKLPIALGLGDRIFPDEVVRVISPMLADRGANWLRGLSKVSAASRTLVAALDLSGSAIQGSVVFGLNPLAWAKATGKMLQIAANPAKLYLELASRKASIMERVLYGGSNSMLDYFESMPLLRNLAGKVGGRTGESVISQTYGRAEAAFLGFGEMARDEMWKTGKFMIGKKAISEVAKEQKLKELARSLDRMTGVMSQRALGIGITQQQIENTWVFFAPRYTRAGISFMGDLLKGGFTGSEARKAMAGWLLGGTTMYQGISAALNQTPNYDPTSARFMTINIGGRHVGVGGVYFAMMRLMADSIATAAQDPMQLSPLNLSRTDNPFYKFLYSRTAPLTGLTVGLAIEHKNYLGEPFENVGDYLEFLAGKVLPISVQNALPSERSSWESQANYPAVFAAEVGGLRTFPQSSWETLANARESLANQSYGKTWGELNRAEQREIEAKSPVLSKLGDEISKSQAKRGKPLDLLFNRWQDELDTAKGKRDQLIAIAAQLYAKENDGVKFRERVDDIENDFSAIMENISSRDEYKPVYETLTNAQKSKDLSDLQYLDAAYNIYSQYRFMKTETPWGKLVNELGEPNFNNIERFETWFRTNFGQEEYQYAKEERPLAGRTLPPAYLELKRAKKAMQSYWKVKDRVIRLFGKAYAESPTGQSFITRQRKLLRTSNPVLNAYYLKFYKS